MDRFYIQNSFIFNNLQLLNLQLRMLARTIVSLGVHKNFCQISTIAQQELSINAPHFHKGGATLGNLPSLAIIST